MIKNIYSLVKQYIPLRIQKIFIGSMFISFGKIMATFLILYLLSNSKDGSLTIYGNYQNIVTILIALIGLSVQNGVTTFSAKSDINRTAETVVPHLITIFALGYFLLILIIIIIELGDVQVARALIGLSEGRFTFYILVITATLSTMLSYYCAVLIGKGLVVQGQILELYRKFLFVIIIGVFVLWKLELDLVWVFLLSNLFIIPILLKSALLESNLPYKPKFNQKTINIMKPGLVTMYSAIIVSVVTILVRNKAIDWGGYALSDLFELLIRIKVMYQLVVSAPLSLILLRSYANAESKKTFYLASKAWPIMLIPVISLLIVPDKFLQMALSFVFNKEFAEFKLVLLLVILAETLRAIGLFFHNFLVTNARVTPQLLFATLVQIIIIVTVFEFSSGDTFILHYFIGYLLSQIIWLALNFFYVRSINNTANIVSKI